MAGLGSRIAAGFDWIATGFDKLAIYFGGGTSTSRDIGDLLFVEQAYAVQQIKAFLIKERILTDIKTIDKYYTLSEIPSYRHSRRGRLVTGKEWQDLDEIFLTLAGQLHIAAPTRITSICFGNAAVTSALRLRRRRAPCSRRFWYLRPCN